MPKGLSINIGINHVSPIQGFPDLKACENDARDMFELARVAGFESTLLLGPQANLDVVTTAIETAATTLVAGDILLLTYSGHGSSVADEDLGEEADGYDETWVLYDSQMVDDALYKLLAKFDSGVRILVLSDSCHSGTIITILASSQDLRLNNRRFLDSLCARFGSPQNRARFVASANGTGFELPRPKIPPYRALLRNYFDNRSYYNDLIAKHRALQRPQLRASVILLSACQDNEIAVEPTDRNGLFTEKLLSVWANGTFSGTYDLFHKKICALTPGQTPNLLPLGPATGEFLNQKPFTITP